MQMCSFLTDLKENSNRTIDHFAAIFVIDAFHFHIAEWRRASRRCDCVCHGRIDFSVMIQKALSLFLLNLAIEFKNVSDRWTCRRGRRFTLVGGP